MQATSDASKDSTSLPRPLPAGSSLAQLQLDQMLALTRWAAAMWAFGPYQFSRYSTFLAGGVPLDA